VGGQTGGQHLTHPTSAGRPCAANAAQIWERRRRIPSATFNDPLDHIFTEFDEDGDGHLTAVEIAHALRSRGVDADEKQVQEFINGEGGAEAATSIEQPTC
jgi:hypothetical protein